MEITIPENMDLSRPKRYVLNIEMGKYPAFSLTDKVDRQLTFRHVFTGNTQEESFRRFRDAFYDNAFFAEQFHKVNVISYLPSFTFVPQLLYDHKDRALYMKFLFTEHNGKILTQALPEHEAVILYSLPQTIFDFLQRSLIDANYMHWTAMMAQYYARQSAEHPSDGKQILVYRHEDQALIMAFVQNQLLFGNQFPCKNDSDMRYYTLYVCQQLTFDNQCDSLFYPIELPPCAS